MKSKKGKDKYSDVYVQNFVMDLQGLSKDRHAVMLDVKNGGNAVSDAMIEKFWLPKIKSNESCLRHANNLLLIEPF